jgi:hypothetical protein
MNEQSTIASDLGALGRSEADRIETRVMCARANAAKRLKTLYEVWDKKKKRDEWLTRSGDLVFPDHPFVAS